MSTPQRIQRQRTRGWRMPEGAIYVGRPSKWGNPWIPRDTAVFLAHGPEWWTFMPERDARQYAVDEFALWVGVLGPMELGPEDLVPLRGHDLACWCPLDQPCHADVLLEIANRQDGWDVDVETAVGQDERFPLRVRPGEMECR